MSKRKVAANKSKHRIKTVSGKPTVKPKRYGAGKESDPQPTTLPEGVRGRLFEQTGLTEKDKFAM